MFRKRLVVVMPSLVRSVLCHSGWVSSHVLTVFRLVFCEFLGLQTIPLGPKFHDNV